MLSNVNITGKRFQIKVLPVLVPNKIMNSRFVCVENRHICWLQYRQLIHILPVYLFLLL